MSLCFLQSPPVCYTHSTHADGDQLLSPRLAEAKKVIALRKLDIFTAHKAYTFCLGKVAQTEMSLNVCGCPRL